MIEIDIEKFNKELKKALALNETKQTEIITKLSVLAFRKLVLNTARRTGRARSGWSVTTNGVPPTYKPVAGLVSYPPPRYTPGRIGPWTVVILGNNVEYIIPLDEGHSKTKPAGMIQPTITALRAVLARLLARESRRRG